MLNAGNLGLAGDHQFINAGLAVELCRCWLQRTGHRNFLPNGRMEAGLPAAFLRGLSTASLPGRVQIVHEKLDKLYNESDGNENSGDLIFYLDGAHSPESMEVCARWFLHAVRDDQHPLKHELIDGKQYNAQTENNHCNGSIKISKKILLFNCMEVRDPQVLLPQLVNTCASNGVHFSKALFAPSMSTYNRVDSGVSAVSFDISQDTSWQRTLQRTWETIIHGKADVILNNYAKIENAELPSNGFLTDPSQKCNPLMDNCTSSAVIPSLPLTIKWLRDCVEDNPSLRLQSSVLPNEVMVEAQGLWSWKQMITVSYFRKLVLEIN